MKIILYSVIFVFSYSYSQCSQLYQDYMLNGQIEILEYVYGEDNCCEEFPISFCNEGTIFYQKEDYADPTDSDNWDIISDENDVALVRGDNQAIYNPLTENSYTAGSPSNTLWKSGITYINNFFNGGINNNNELYTASGVYAIVYIPKYLPGTFGSIYSIPDSQYYDIHFTSWTSGNGTGWPGGGSDGSGGGGGGGVSYWRSGPIDASPIIVNVQDILDDQGGRVYLEIKRSMIDIDVHPTGVDNYSVLRYDSPNWINIGSFGAQNEQFYFFEALTLLDSSSQNNGLTAFKVIAQNYSADLSFTSKVEFGYSVDNLAPSSPANFNFAVNQGILQLSWQQVSDSDFSYYEIDKSADSLFQTDQYGSIIVYGTNYTDQEYFSGETIYYRISTLDHGGNRSPYSQTLTVSSSLNTDIIKNLPTEFKLHQNYPNPFNPVTRLIYDLPKDSFVSITIYDMLGNVVNNLVNANQSSGYKSVQWDATNNQGQPVSAGVYLYSIETKDFRQTKKMILLK